MNIKKAKVFCYPFKVVKKIFNKMRDDFHYINSLYYIKKNKQRVKKKISDKEIINVLFIIQYIPGWNKLEPIYSRMRRDARFNPTIVCVPLNIQNHRLMDNNGNDTYRYFIEHGYDVIDAYQAGKWLDLEELKPDYLFHSRPYNFFMPDAYTSSKIVKYALICNLLYGLPISKNEEKVCLNTDYYSDVYLYFSADISDKSFYEKRFKIGSKLHIQKCLPFGAIGLEQILNVKKNKEGNGFKKTVIWTPRWSTDVYIGGSNFFNYKETIVGLARKYVDVLFIFRPHPLMFNNFIKTGEMTEDEVLQFKSYCQSEKNIVLDESKEYSETFWKSDFLITDLSSVFPEYFVTGKPVIYCHSNAKFEYLGYASDMIKSCYEAYNSSDLKNYLDLLILDKDNKSDERERCINLYFKDVDKNSCNILEALQRI